MQSESTPTTGPTVRELEIAAISISVAAGCVPCVRHHVKAAKRHGATDAESQGALALGSAIAAVSDARMQSRFLRGAAARQEEPAAIAGPNILGAIGAAIARNDTAQTKALIRQADEAGVAESSIAEVGALALTIKEKAASHVRKLVASLRVDTAGARRATELCS